MNNNVRLQTIGDIDRLPENARAKFMQCIEQTSGNTGLTMVLALSYSARWEITRAMQKAAQMAKEGDLRIEDINEQFVSANMTTADIPDPDLLIRTSGEYRISNFLLWQLAYSELYFTDCLWPDFTTEELYKAIVDYQKRERRFGKTSEQIS
jgi:undecaprenyl diphosphate synthase